MDVEQIGSVGSQGVADVAERRSIGQDDLPVSARARQQLAVDLWTGKCPTGQRHDAPVALRDLAEIKRLTEGGLQAIDQGQARLGKPVAHVCAAAILPRSSFSAET